MPFSIKKFCTLTIALLLGCHSVGHAEFTKRKATENLLISLMKDAGDGSLEMPLEQASLIASGVNTEKKIHKYLAKFNLLVSQINQETDINKIGDPLSKTKTIFWWLQKNANNGIYNDCYDIRDTLNLKVGNCLSFAIRFTVICRHFDIEINNIFVPGHIYSVQLSGEKTYYFEHTHSDGIVKKFDAFHPERRIMKDIELIAEIFLYKARDANYEMKYETSLDYCKQAIICNPNDDRPVILLLDNYIKRKRYNEAFLYLDNYLSLHPHNKKSLERTYTLLQKLCKKENNSF